MSDKILRLPDVKALTGLSRSTIYQMVAEQTLPPPIRLSPHGRCVGWVQSELETWLSDRIAASRSSSAAGSGR